MLGIILLMMLGLVFADGIDTIKEDLEKKGKNVKSITKVDFNDLPDQIVIEDKNPNLDIYEVDVGEERPIFAITYVDKPGEIIEKEKVVVQDRRQFLNFGFSGEMSDSGFLQTSTGVSGDLERGYVMMRQGSITGISTNLDVLNEDDSGQIEMIIYKNGEEVGFRNTLDAFSSGIKKDYDLQSKSTVNFYPGDVISVYVDVEGDISWRDVISMIEITTIN